MDTRKREVSSVDISRQCFEKKPCEHTVITTYDDGEKKKKKRNADNIREKYSSFFNDNERRHFAPPPANVENEPASEKQAQVFNK